MGKCVWFPMILVSRKFFPHYMKLGKSNAHLDEGRMVATHTYTMNVHGFPQHLPHICFQSVFVYRHCMSKQQPSLTDGSTTRTTAPAVRVRKWAESHLICRG